MRFSTYMKYRGGWLDAMNLESLMESLSDFFMNGGFSGGPNYHPFWGWSGLEDTSSVDALKNALLKALVESGQLTQEMVRETRWFSSRSPTSWTISSDAWSRRVI